jgi:hypothetical protein
MAMGKMVRVVVVGVNIDAKRAVIQDFRHPLTSPFTYMIAHAGKKGNEPETIQRKRADPVARIGPHHFATAHAFGVAAKRY